MYADVWSIYVLLCYNRNSNNWIYVVLLQLVKDDLPKREKRHKDVEPIQANPVTPIEKYIKVDPSPRPFPKTTAQNIGWRSTHDNLALDKYGKYAKPKGGLVKQLNWPSEAIS